MKDSMTEIANSTLQWNDCKILPTMLTWLKMWALVWELKFCYCSTTEAELVCDFSATWKGDSSENWTHIKNSMKDRELPACYHSVQIVPHQKVTRCCLILGVENDILVLVVRNPTTGLRGNG